MQISLNDYGDILVANIQIAGSQEEVKIYIDNLLQKMKQNNEAVSSIALFVDTTIQQLGNLNPMDKDANQWSNIKMARIHLQQIKREFELIPSK